MNLINHAKIQSAVSILNIQLAITGQGEHDNSSSQESQIQYLLLLLILNIPRVREKDEMYTAQLAIIG